MLKQTSSLVEKEGCDKQKKSWWDLLKYLVVLVVPAFLNHAALYREAGVLKPLGEYGSFVIKTKFFAFCGKISDRKVKNVT